MKSWWINLNGDYRTDHVLENPLPDYLDEKDISGWYLMVRAQDLRALYDSILNRTGGPLPWPELEALAKILESKDEE